MRQITVLAIVGALLAGAASPALAGTVTLGASQDSYITLHANQGGSSSVHGLDDTIFSVSVNQTGGPFNTIPVVEFDLSAYAGRTASSGGTLTLWTWYTNAGGVTQDYDVSTVRDPWSESTMSWDNNANGRLSYGSQQVTAVAGGSVSFSISQALIQEWIDSPGTNFGVWLTPTSFSAPSTHSDIFYYSRESSTGLGPTLTFDVAAVPLPPAAWSGVALLGAIALVGARRRRAAAPGDV